MAASQLLQRSLLGFCLVAIVAVLALATGLFVVPSRSERAPSGNFSALRFGDFGVNLADPGVPRYVRVCIRLYVASSREGTLRRCIEEQ